jgi:DNA-binding transcriptional regulator GbsR (MarR family)
LAPESNSARRRFSDLFGDIGSAWGLPKDACRVHALIYVNAEPASLDIICDVLQLSKTAAVEAISFLNEYDLAWSVDDETYGVHGDPWEALMTGLDKRRGRDLPAMRASLDDCRRELAGNGAGAGQVGKLISLIDDMSAIHAQTFRLSPRVLRTMVGFSGRAARMFGGNRR